MSTSKSAWGIEIGADAIKAIRLEREGDRVVVSDFAVIPHKKVLSTPDLDQDEMVRLSLGQFISQESLEGEHLVMSVPGHSAFARFAKLPPVEPKKVPDIVKFEAVQQIPFPIDEVEWDYQTFTSEDSPEIEVGIFAITRDRVQQRLGLWGELGVSPESLTLSPVALYNAMAYDLDLKDNHDPVVFLDIGTQATDVVIADEGRCWIRTFPLGGTHFTEAIASAFKLSYSKAEKLKREAATSKYAKQIMQAMRPVFSDLLQDLQRSIGYYQSLHRDRDLTTMVGVGSTFKIPGLRKFIGQQLQMNVARLDEFKKITVTGREAASFAEHAVNMASAYGLALQGVGLAPIDANLVPVKALREQMWHSKTKWFAAAAAIIVIGSATLLYHPLKDRSLLDSTTPGEVSAILSRGEKLKKDFDAAVTTAAVGFTAENMRRLTDDREVWPFLVHDAAAALASTDPQEELLAADFDAMRNVPPAERRLVSLQRLDGVYAPPADATSKRRIAVTLEVELSHARPVKFLNDTVAQWLRDNADPVSDRETVPYRILVDTISTNPASLETILIDESGDRQSRGGEAARPPRAPSAPKPPDRERPAAPTRQPPGSIPGGAGPGTSAPGLGAGGGGGRRQPPPNKRLPPGAIRGGSGLGGTPGAVPGSSGGAPSRPGNQTGGRTPERPVAAGDLDAIAPMPTQTDVYPPNSRYYRVPITFEIEILDRKKPSDASRADAGNTGGQG